MTYHGTKRDQLIKELQMHVDTPSLNEIIEDKMMEVWRDARREEESANARQWLKLQKSMELLSSEEKKKMSASHIWIDRGSESACPRCGTDDQQFSYLPQYCIKNED